MRSCITTESRGRSSTARSSSTSPSPSRVCGARVGSRLPGRNSDDHAAPEEASVRGDAAVAPSPTEQEAGGGGDQEEAGVGHNRRNAAPTPESQAGGDGL